MHPEFDRTFAEFCPECGLVQSKTCSAAHRVGELRTHSAFNLTCRVIEPRSENERVQVVSQGLKFPKQLQASSRAVLQSSSNILTWASKFIGFTNQ